MRKRAEILQNNYEASKIDFVGAYIRLWVSFNTWYNDNSRDRSEVARVLAAGNARKLRDSYESDVDQLNEPAHNDNYLHIIETVESHSVHTYTDSNGNPVTARTDSTGFKYRLRCNRTNEHSRFLLACSEDAILQSWCQGLAFFDTETRKDPLFGVVYRGYGESMMHRMSERFDAFEDIPRLLGDMGIKQYGSLLFHDLETPGTDTTRIAKLSDIYGVPFVSMMSRANKVPSKSQAKKKYPRAAEEGSTYKWTEARGLDLLRRELLLLYKLRSSIIHGDRDPQSPLEQQLARTAYEALNLLLRPVY